MAEDIPDGTVADVLNWVGDDPARAQMALDAEYAGANRTTLIAALEPIAKEATAMTDAAPTTADEEVELAPGPEAPEVYVDPADESTTILPTVLAHSEVDYAAEYDEDGVEVLPDGNAVESLGGAVAPHGFVLVINGDAFAFSPQMVAALKAIVQTAATGVTL